MQRPSNCFVLHSSSMGDAIKCTLQWQKLSVRYRFRKKKQWLLQPQLKKSRASFAKLEPTQMSTSVLPCPWVAVHVPVVAQRAWPRVGMSKRGHFFTACTPCVQCFVNCLARQLRSWRSWSWSAFFFSTISFHSRAPSSYPWPSAPWLKID